MEESMQVIPGYDSYFVTRTGRVFSAPNLHHKTLHEIKLQKGRTGKQDNVLRVKIAVDNKWYKIHKLVAEVYLPKPEGCNDVRHKDGNKENNTVENLEWYFNEKLHRAISYLGSSWSKYGGSNQGIGQEDKKDIWACQACGDPQASELPAYMFEFMNNEFMRICSVCQSLKLVKHIEKLADLISAVRHKREVWLEDFA